MPQLKAANAFTGNQTVTGDITTSGDLFANGFLSTATGVYSTYGSFLGNGVYAYGPNYGVYSSETEALFGAGVYGQLVGASQIGSSFVPPAGVWGDTNVQGGTGVGGSADDGVAGRFDNNAPYTSAVLAVNHLAGGPVFNAWAANGGQCEIDGSGNLGCTGSKSAVVPVDSASRTVALYAVEAPENWFEDFGSGQLSGGLATISLEPTFAQTVNTGMEYNVFITPYGDCEGLYVTDRDAEGFRVRELHGGHSNVAFGYRIVARRRGYETIRLADKTKEFDPGREFNPRRMRGNTTDPIKPLTAKPPAVPFVSRPNETTTPK